MPAAFIRSAHELVLDAFATITAPLARAKTIVASIAAREPSRLEVMVRLRPQLEIFAGGGGEELEGGVALADVVERARMPSASSSFDAVKFAPSSTSG